MKPLTIEELMYPASALPDIKRRAIKEFAEQLNHRMLGFQQVVDLGYEYKSVRDIVRAKIYELVKEYEK